MIGLLKIFQQNLHIYHTNDSTSLCTIHFIYILVLEDVIVSDVRGRFLLAHLVYIYIYIYIVIPLNISKCWALHYISPEKLVSK